MPPCCTNWSRLRSRDLKSGRPLTACDTVTR
uniref:Uncharacterized protein n=1 Tax=Anguilla anguilla TaxID=7936 RepID=A0A0E9PD74_ANGAN